MRRLGLLFTLCILLFLFSAPPVFAGPICTGVTCVVVVPWFYALFLFLTYQGWGILGLLITLIAIIGLIKTRRNKSGYSKVLIPFLVVGLILLSIYGLINFKLEQDFQAQSKNAVSHIDFDLYIPKYTPPSRKVIGVRMNTDMNSPFLEINYNLDSKKEELNVYEYSLSKTPLAKSRNCGESSPEFDDFGFAQSCTLVKTTNGLKIYTLGSLDEKYGSYEGGSSTLSYTIYHTATIDYGNTRIVIEGYDLSYEEIFKMIFSLEKTPPQKIHFVRN